MTFVPQAGTPLEDVRPAGDADELLTIAALRLAMPDRFIPASLDVDGIAGLERRLQAGANVVTSIVPPTVGLAGVSQAELDIDEGYRTVHGVLPHLPARAAAGRGRTSTASAWRALAARPGEAVRLLIVGGKLQGTEAAYLAAKAGWETVLVDRREAPPAAGLADRHVVADITADEDAPAEPRHRAATPCCPPARTSRPRVAGRSASRRGTCRCSSTSTRTGSPRPSWPRGSLFARLDAPRPRDWPACGSRPWSSPARPAAARGWWSRGTRPAWPPRGGRWSARGHEVVVEEYVAGPSLSLEVLAWNGRAVPLQVTGLEFDASYDCRRVVAPVGEAAGEPACSRPRRRLRLARGRRPRRARGVRGRLGARRRGARPERAHGRGGDGVRPGAQAPGGRCPPAQPDADGGATGPAGSTSSSCWRGRCATRRHRRSTAPPAAPACTSTCAPREVCWRSSAST